MWKHKSLYGIYHQTGLSCEVSSYYCTPCCCWVQYQSSSDGEESDEDAESKQQKPAATDGKRSSSRKTTPPRRFQAGAASGRLLASPSASANAASAEASVGDKETSSSNESLSDHAPAAPATPSPTEEATRLLKQLNIKSDSPDKEIRKWRTQHFPRVTGRSKAAVYNGLVTACASDLERVKEIVAAQQSSGGSASNSSGASKEKAKTTPSKPKAGRQCSQLTPTTAIRIKNGPKSLKMWYQNYCKPFDWDKATKEKKSSGLEKGEARDHYKNYVMSGEYARDAKISQPVDPETLMIPWRAAGQPIAFGSELAKLCGRTPTTFTDGNKVWSFTLKKKKSK